jgi:hypothetical protein
VVEIERDEVSLPAKKSLSEWSGATLIDRIIVWDRWLEAGIGMPDTKEAQAAAIAELLSRLARIEGGKAP